MWSRGLCAVRNTNLVPLCRLSVAARKETGEIDDFLQSISPGITPTSVKHRTVLETASELTNWLKQNPVKSFDQLMDFAHAATNVKHDEQKKAFAIVNSIAEKELPKFYEQLDLKEIITAMRLFLQISPNGKTIKDIESKFLEKNITVSDLLAVPFKTLIMLIRYSSISTDQKTLNIIADTMTMRMEKELGNSADLLAILAGNGFSKSKWFHNDSFVKTTEKLITVMGTPEKCALLKHMALHKQRNKKLIGAIIHSICVSTQCLTVSQIVSVTSSCASLTYYSEKISNKIASDLEKNSNTIEKWDDVMIITDSFVRMRTGNRKSWNLLIRWGTENVKQASIEQLCRFVSGLARIGEPDGKPLAKMLKPLIKREKVSTPTSWLNIVFSLAYFQELDPVHADSVLNKNFVDQLLNSTKEVHDRLRKAMTLMMISSAAKIDMQEQYTGPTVDKETFTKYGIHFDVKTTLNARQLKYSNKTDDVEAFFHNTLFKLAPRDTHCQLPNVEECGAFVDAYVMPDKKSGLLVSISQWNSAKPRPLFFYGYLQTKQNSESVTDEGNLLGQEQLALRLMRADGYDPVVIFNSEFAYGSTDINRVNMLRDKIHKNN